MEDEKYECVSCGKEAKYVDSERDCYCSEECYFKEWKTKITKTEELKVFFCLECKTRVEHCSECEALLSSETIVCDADQGNHFCNNDCLLKFYNWRSVEEIDKEND